MMKFFQLNNDGLVIPVTHTFTDELSLEGAQEITPNTVEAAAEKHVPVIQVSNGTVTVNVGSVTHPMTEEHLITTVILETQKGGQYKFLAHDQQPVVHFELSDDDHAVAAYAYCNLHGIWKVEIA